MHAYFTFAFLIGALSVLDISEVRLTIKKIFFWSFCIGVVLFVGLRNEIGLDWGNYAEIFNDLRNDGYTDHLVEIGYVWLNLLIARFGGSLNSVMLVTATVSVGLKFFASYRFSTAYFIPIVFYSAYYLTEYEMSGIRQALAMGFALLGLTYLREKKTIQFLCCILAGSVFHVSILALMPAFLLTRLKLSERTAIVLLASAMLLTLINIQTLVLSLVTTIPLGNFIQEKMVSYTSVHNPTGISLGHLIFLSFAAVFVYFRRICTDPFYNGLLNIFLTGVLLTFLFSGSLSVLNRVSYYYLITGGFLFALIFESSRRLSNKIIIVGLLWIFLFVKIYESIASQETRDYYIPYKAILSN